MSNDNFRFKHFAIHQERCAMKVGTDSVLLGAWATMPQGGSILDIGCGSGILSLMAAQRNPAGRITGVEIDPDAAAQARENVAGSIWSDRIDIVEADFNHYAATCNEQYDVIISNPPYFNDSLHSPQAARTTARHTVNLQYSAIFDLSRRLLRDGGTLAMVLPTQLWEHVNGEAMMCGWSVTRCTYIATRPGKAPKRMLCEWQRGILPTPHSETLTIEERAGEYSQAYVELTRDFYLKF